MLDGVVELGLNDDLVEGSLIKQVRVRKMSGVLALPKWTLYEYTASEGIVTIELHEGPPDESDAAEDDDSADDEEEPALATEESGESSGDGSD